MIVLLMGVIFRLGLWARHGYDDKDSDNAGAMQAKPPETDCRLEKLSIVNATEDNAESTEGYSIFSPNLLSGTKYVGYSSSRFFKYESDDSILLLKKSIARS